MDPHQKLKQEYLKTQRAAHAAWLEEQARHTTKRTAKPQHVTSTNLYNHKDPDKTADNPSSNTQGINGSRADLSLPVDNIIAPGSYMTPKGIRVNITTPQEQMRVLTKHDRRRSCNIRIFRKLVQCHPVESDQ